MVAEEKYEFKPETKRKIFILGAVGVVLFVLGVFLAMSGGHEEHGKAADEHAKAAATENLVASAAINVIANSRLQARWHHTPVSSRCFVRMSKRFLPRTLRRAARWRSLPVIPDFTHFGGIGSLMHSGAGGCTSWHG